MSEPQIIRNADSYDLDTREHMDNGVSVQMCPNGHSKNLARHSKASQVFSDGFSDGQNKHETVRQDELSDTREQLETDMQNLNGYPTLCKSLANYVAGLLIAKSDEAYKRGYDDGLHANTKAAFVAAKQAFGVEGDTREQLEADVHQYANPGGYKNTLGASWEKKMLSFLDRQAAIDRKEFHSILEETQTCMRNGSR